MANPSSRVTLTDYCLRKLGAPVLEINVDEDQVNDRIDDALQFYQEYNSDAIMKLYLKHQVTQDDITNKYITLNDNIISVRRIFPKTSESYSGMFSGAYQTHWDNMSNTNFLGELVHYEMMQQYASLLDMKLTGSSEFTRFNRHMNTLHIDMDWGTMNVGEYLLLDCARVIDPQTNTDIYNDMFLKEYATALIKQQWGANLIKFDGMVLPGGVTLNGRQIYDDASAEIERIKESMQLTYEMPIDFYTG
jgi:hypothetical protein